MEHSFTNSKRRWTRRDIPGQTVKVTVSERMFGEYPSTRTVWEGPHILTDGEREWLCGRSVTNDTGKYGVALSFSELRKPLTAEQSAALRMRLDLTIRQIWPGYRLAAPQYGAAR